MTTNFGPFIGKVANDRTRGFARRAMIRQALAMDIRGDAATYADMVGSMNDHRTALSISIGVPLEHIDPTTGHDMRTYH